MTNSKGYLITDDEGNIYKDALPFAKSLKERRRFYYNLSRNKPWDDGKVYRKINFDGTAYERALKTGKAAIYGMADKEFENLNWCDVLRCNDRKNCLDKNRPVSCPVWRLWHSKNLPIEE